jgi:deoxycytidylate deaminase
MKDYSLLEILPMFSHILRDERACAKQETIAVIITPENKVFVGTNWCENPQEVCPRKDLPTGVGYEMCKNICKQQAHAEVDACRKAGKEANGADLYLIGHYYCCDNCKEIMEQYGILNTHIVEKK